MVEVNFKFRHLTKCRTIDLHLHKAPAQIFNKCGYYKGREDFGAEAWVTKRTWHTKKWFFSIDIFTSKDLEV